MTPSGPPPGRWHTREDSGLRLDRNLTWWHDGERIEHPNIIEAFNRGVKLSEDGRAVLEFGGDWCFVSVDDCLYSIVAVDELTDGRLGLRLSDRTAELLDPTTLSVDEEGALVARVKSGRARARFTRASHLALAEHLEPGPLTLHLRVGATLVPTSLPNP